MCRARKNGASEFWQPVDVDVERVELQREALHNHKTTNNNNNNNYTQHTDTHRTTDNQIYTGGDPRTPCRYCTKTNTRTDTLHVHHKVKIQLLYQTPDLRLTVKACSHVTITVTLKIKFEKSF